MVDNRTLPWSWYTDPAILALERDHIFRTSWQYVGHTGLLQGAESFFPARLGTIPVVVTRTADERLRALLNVCAHRGAIVCEAAGTRSTLHCPYHAWSYELDGSLRSAPRADREPDFDPTAHRLTPLAVDTWGPFVFAAADPATSLADALGDIPARVAEVIDLDRLRFHHRFSGDYAANWKVCVENYLECYHCRVAHPTFAKVVDTGPDDYRLESHGAGSSQYGPIKQGWTGSFDPTGPVGRGQFHLVNPNTAINIFPGHPNLSIGPVIPEAPGRTHRYLDYFFGADVADDWIKQMLALDDQVGAEDVALVESVQRGMEAGMRPHGTLFLDSEVLIAGFADYVRSALPVDG